MRSYFTNVSFILISIDENFQAKVRLNFDIDGKIRQDFYQENLEKAYDLGDRKFSLYTNVKIIKKGQFLNNEILVDEIIIRKAAIFWTRNPQINKRIWVELILEDKKPYLFYNFDEIKNNLFSFNKEYNINLYKFNRNKVLRLFPVLTAKWAEYNFTHKDQITYRGDPLIIRMDK